MKMQFVLFILILVVVLTSVNFYVYTRIMQALALHGTWKIVFTTAFIFTAASFILSALLANVLPISILKFLQNLGSGWMMPMAYLFFIFLAGDLIFAISAKISHTDLLGAKHIFTYATLGFVGILCVIGYIRFDHPKTEHLQVKISDKYPLKKTYKIAFASDWHLGATINKKRLHKWVEQINVEKPDLIIIGGDLVDREMQFVHAEEMDDELRNLHAPLGVYVVYGNHDYMAGLKQTQELFAKSNIRLLQDESLMIDSAFYLIGRDDMSNRKRKSVTELTHNIDKNFPTILVDHQPAEIDSAVKNHISLQLSGHTHNGQFWPLNYITSAVYKVGYGYKKINETNVYTSSGLGIWGPKFRVGSQSEIVMIEFGN